MSASSLIFFVILAVWAAYMLKHWVRRRENLATARTVDRFSEAMRMLERRTPVKADVTTRSDASSEQSSRRILRPQVSVKGATAVSADAASGTPRAAKSAGVKGSAAKGGRLAASRGAAALADPKVKLGALVAALGFFLVTAVLAPFTAVPAWMPLLGLVAVVGVVAWLRRSAIAARQARAARPVARRSAPRRASGAEKRDVAFDADVTTSRSGGSPVGATRVERSAGAVKVGGPATDAPAAVRATTRSPLVADIDVASWEAESDTALASEVVFDQEPQDAAARAEAELFDNAAWAPVDVPRPTYTMKAKAEREAVAPAATVDDVDARPLAARYENTPVEDLPFDGMALDEDYEELPQVYRAG